MPMCFQLNIGKFRDFRPTTIIFDLIYIVNGLDRCISSVSTFSLSGPSSSGKIVTKFVRKYC
jgi:hypothetical protein